jgi:hypothetical protein
MKSKIYATLLIALCATQVFAQCGQRYKDMIFNNVTKTSNVTYSTENGTTLKMDIFEPTGDTELQRPVLIMAHGGSFTAGDKSESVCVSICNNFAKRGYVTASIQYRLGQTFQMLDSAYAIETVMKAISDGKSAIRFFRKDAATTNTYRINPDFILAGGNSAGAVLFMHVIYIDSVNECPQNLRNIINANGGIEGNSGNDGYSSKLQGLINLAGGLNVPEFIGPGSGPSFNAQGTADVTVPYSCANAQGGITPVRLCGLGVAQPLYDQFLVRNRSIIYPGQGHCPWQNNAAMLNEIDTASANFFYDVQCDLSTSVLSLKETSEVSLFPNPTSNEINVRSSMSISNISLFDNIGQLISLQNIENGTAKINTSNLSKGIYYVKMEFIDNNISTIVRKVVIE